MAVTLVNFGCRLNAYEGEAIQDAALGAGFAEGETIVVNSCAVTGEALRQARQTIRRLSRDRPQARIVVTGCGAQTEPARFAAMPEVARVIGNLEKTDPAAWRRLRADMDMPGAAALGMDTPERKIAVSDIMRAPRAAPLTVSGIDGNPRAYVQIQNGCDHRCTFCIIPFARGPSRSVPVAAIVAEARAQVEAGITEIVLTGVDITSYGGDLPGAPQLGGLVRTLLREVPDLPRLRLSSIDVAEIDPDLSAAFAEEERLMPHLHLSLQAGDDLILKRMKRRHSRHDAIALCTDLRALRPDIVFGADLIAGFPTETEAMFANTLDLADACGLTFLHVFPYSAREGTPAARMPQCAGDVIRDRARRLRAKAADCLRATLAGEVGRMREVFVESAGKGRTAHFLPVRFAAALPPGAIRPMAIGAADDLVLHAA